MSCWLRFIPLALILAPLPALGSGKKTYGQVTDLGALRGVQNYCVELNKLDPAEAADVKKFLEREDQPKRLLAKMPWKRVEDCTHADAVVSLKFEQRFGVAQGPGAGTLQGMPTTAMPEPAFSAEMLVTDRASGRPLYRVKGESVAMRREGAIGSPFSKLERDLKVLSK